MNTPEELIPVIDWWQKDGKKTLAIVACVGVVALAVYLWVARERRLDVEASSYAYSGNYTVQELQDASVKYSGRDVAGMIKLRLAKAYFSEKEYNKALEVYTLLADEKSLPAVFALAPQYGIATCNEASANWAGAKAAYDSVAADSRADAMLVLDAKLGSARCLAFAGNRDAAVKLLEEMKSAAGEDKNALERIDQNIDVVKRWEKREKPQSAPVAVEKAETAAVEVKSDVKASDLTLPSAAPKAPAKEPAAAQPVKAK